MKNPIHHVANFLRVAIAASSLGACANMAQAQNVATNIPVIVMGEDEDPNSVKRSSDIFKRVLAELKIAMQRDGFQMLDEEFVAVKQGWKIRDRRPKSELIQVVDLLNGSSIASHRPRAMVLFRIHATAKDVGFATKVTTRIDGEIYDIQTNRFLDGFEMPTATYPAPADCLEQGALCINEVVGTRAREIAMSLGSILAKKLERYSPSRVSGGGSSVTGASAVAASSDPLCANLPTNYTVTLRYFDNVEALSIIGVMSDEFPCHLSHDLIDKASALRRYSYESRAKAGKIEEWLVILLRDMGFDVDRQIEISVDRDQVLVTKLVPTPDRPVSKDEAARFN